MIYKQDTKKEIKHLFDALKIPGRWKWKIFYGRAYDLSISKLEEAITLRKESLKKRYNLYMEKGPKVIAEKIPINALDTEPVIKALQKIIENKRK